MKGEKFFITTPIYYVNDVPHIGHAYTTIIADILARWHRLAGRRSFFLTGLDENSVNTIRGAKKAGMADIKKYTDVMAGKWIATWKALGIENDDFIRTTEERHRKFVRQFFLKVNEKGDIYKGRYSGLYCDACEAFLSEGDLIEGKCPFHKAEPKRIEEENYFFRLSKYADKVLEHIEKNPDFIQPESRRNEVTSFIRSGVKDISISRPRTDWGIELPIDSGHIIWVWFDALVNYISACPENWPAEIHLIGKDILRFHTVIWGSMLMAAGYELPKTVFAHGFFTVNGQKMSKTLGNVTDPVAISAKYGTDAIRYYLAREIPFGEDGDFSEDVLKKRINGELLSDLGNLVNRVITIAVKFEGKIEGQAELEKYLDFKRIEGHMGKLEIHHALDAIWNFIRQCNRYVNDKQPWKLEGKELSNALYNLLESLRIISILIYPFMPNTAERICGQLDVKPGTFGDIKFKKFGGKPRKGELLFRYV